MRTRSRAFLAHLRQCVAERRGAAVVEFAIIFPLLIILLFGMIDFGRAFFLRNNLVSAAREGARAGATMTNPCGEVATIRARVRSSVTTFGGAPPTDAQIPVAFQYSDGSPSNCTSTTLATNVIDSVKNYPFTPITPVFRLIGSSQTLSITVAATYRWEQSNVP